MTQENTETAAMFFVWAIISALLFATSSVLVFVYYNAAFSDDRISVFQQQAALQRATIAAVFAAGFFVATAIFAVGEHIAKQNKQ